MKVATKDIGINIIASIVGVITALLIFLLIILVEFLFLVMFPLNSKSVAAPIIQIFSIIAISVSCIGGGYITGLFVRKKYLIYTFITGIALVTLYSIKHDFKINNEIFSILPVILIVPLTIIGGYLNNKKS